MARATITGKALKNMVDRVELVRTTLSDIDEKYESISPMDFPSDLNSIRDWYLSLIDQGAKDIMLESDDYRNYFYILGIDIYQYELRAKTYHDQQASYKQNFEDSLEKARQEAPKRGLLKRIFARLRF
jgi:hypothetical protein